MIEARELYAAEIRVPLLGGGWRRGSGYAVAPNRILTALHVVFGADALLAADEVPLPPSLEIRVNGDFAARFPEARQFSVERAFHEVRAKANGDFLWRPAALAWPNPGGRKPGLDLAVLSVGSEVSLPYISNAPTPRCMHPLADIDCRGTGFPQWADLSISEDIQLANPTPILGTLIISETRYGGAHPVLVRSGAPLTQSGWAALSGTALFAQHVNALVGVVTQALPVFGNTGLGAVLLADATTEEEFASFWRESALIPPTTLRIGRADKNTQSVSITKPLEQDLQAQIEACRQRDVKFRTAHIIAALLRKPMGLARQCFRLVSSKAEEVLLDTVDRFISNQERSAAERGFVWFDLEAHPLIETAKIHALECWCTYVDERLLLIAVMNSDSGLLNKLRGELGSSVIEQVISLANKADETFLAQMGTDPEVWQQE